MLSLFSFKRYFSFVFTLCIAFLVNNHSAKAQCTVDIFANPATITCGDSTFLSAFGHTGNYAMDNDFNDGTVGTGWSATSSATFTNPCGPGPDGTTYLWMGDATPHPRILTTQAYDLSTGGIICFDLKFATQGQASPCEGPDLPDEGVFLEYSVDGGNTWEVIHYFHPEGGYDPVLTQWNNYCFSIPADAMTPSTQIRWRQGATSGPEFDHWGLDNIEIIVVDPDYYYVWEHDGSIGQDAPPVYPKEDSLFTVYLTNGTNDTCSATIQIEVNPPTFLTSIEPQDSTLCDGECIELNAEADVLVSPASQPTFQNNFEQPIVAIFGQTVSEAVDISVANLNMDVIEPGSIQSVCLHLTFLPDLADISISLVCPDGNSLLLTESATGNQMGGAFGSGSPACFTIDATQTISQGSPDYQGDFLPDAGGSLDDFVGCTAEGLWSLEVEVSGFFGQGFLNSWSITFNDPEIRVPANYHWTPTTDLSDPSLLDPVACPSETTTYTLTVYDVHQCDTTSVDVTINVIPECCDLEIDDIAATDPGCDNNDGTITITSSGAVGTVNYSIDNGATFQTNNEFTELSAGTYLVLAEDDNCSTDTFSIELIAPDFPVLQLENTVQPTCGDNDGEITVSVSGGTASYTFNWSGGQTDSIAINLAGGNYTVAVIDDNGCSDTLNITLTDFNAAVIDDTNLAVDHTPCGVDEGAISGLTVTGLDPFDFNWTDQSASTVATTLDVSDLPAGSYTLIVTDDDGCLSSYGPVEIEVIGEPEADESAMVIEAANCGLSDGQITGILVTGNDPFDFVWQNDAGDQVSTSQTTPDLTAQPIGDYTLYATDAGGCEIVLGPYTIEEADLPEITNAVLTDPQSCDVTDGSISVTVSGGTGGPYTYIWSHDATLNSPDAQNLSSGTYTLVVEDQGGSDCAITETYTLSTPDDVEFDVISTDVSCFGEDDGTATVNVTEGTAPFTYNWSTSDDSETVSGLEAGSYSVEVIDANNCVMTQTFDIAEPDLLTAEMVETNSPACNNGNDGSAEVEATGGIEPYTFTWDAFPDESGSSLTDASAGDYMVTVTDDNNCSATVNFTLDNPPPAEATATATPTEVVLGEAVELTAEVVTGLNEPITYAWEPTFWVDCTDCQTTTAVPLEDTTFTVMLTDADGCQAEASVFVSVEEIITSIYIPNVFSPGIGTGNNDRFQVFGNGIRDITLRVFDRWGTLVFESNDPNATWDGTYNGTLLSTGTFVYTAKVIFTNGEMEDFAGSVLLVR